MSHFVPCPACNRHVMSTETACPFCTAAMPECFCAQTPAPRPPGRLSRAAMLAAGAALLGAEACNTATPVYGAPAPDGSVPMNDAASTDSADGSAVALYGAAPAPLEETPADNGAAPQPTGRS